MLDGPDHTRLNHAVKSLFVKVLAVNYMLHVNLMAFESPSMSSAVRSNALISLPYAAFLTHFIRDTPVGVDSLFIREATHMVTSSGIYRTCMHQE